mmetsp:Transcript_11020/g.17322  ORF Transcript_11020/g.17322 Transcript_11020/m.17322 type:complete len:440 (-) Transcript_11020:76-1395(-)
MASNISNVSQEGSNNSEGQYRKMLSWGSSEFTFLPTNEPPAERTPLDPESKNQNPEDSRSVTVRVINGISTVSVDRLRKAIVMVGHSDALTEVALKTVEQLQTYEAFQSITILAPKEVVYAGPEHERVRSHVVDYNNLASSRDLLSGHDVGFLFVGHCKEEVGADGFWKCVEALGTSGLDEIDQMDRWHVEEAARILCFDGCSHLHLISTQGADAESIYAFLKAKGEAEQAVQNTGFQRVTTYRIGYLKGYEWNSVGSAITGTLVMPAVEVFMPTEASVNSQTLSKCIAATALARSTQDFVVLENEEIIATAGSKGDGWLPMDQMPEVDQMEIDFGKPDPNEEDIVLSMFDFQGEEEEDKPTRKKDSDEKEGEFKIELPQFLQFNGTDKSQSKQDQVDGETDSWVKLPDLSNISVPDVKQIFGGKQEVKKGNEISTQTD